MDRNEQYMFIIRPDDFLSLYIRNFDDIIEYKDLLIQSNLTQSSIRYLIKFIYEHYKNLKRKQNVLVTQITYKILKRFKNNSNRGINVPDPETIDRLFFLFQQIVNFHFKEDWRLSIFLKDWKLQEDQIQWLLDHSNEDEKILNRIIRYPEQNEKITKWCQICLDLECEKLDRCSEYLGKIYNSVEKFQDIYNSKKYETYNIIRSLKYCYLDYNCIKECLDFLLIQEPKNFFISDFALKLDLEEIIVKQYELNKYV